MSGSSIRERLSKTRTDLFSAYCILAAFGTYFCMYAYRKPFTAGTFEDDLLWGIDYKTILVVSQVIGYTISKFLGVKYVSEIRGSRRGWAILGLIGFAEFSLLLFAVVPAPYNFVFLLLNGLPLGMVFGLVLRFLEGRRVTEALSAGLCASFIVSSGVVKSIGRWMVLEHGVSEYWMPFLTGLLFSVPLALFVWMLRQIPPPSPEDVEHRSERAPMNRESRKRLLKEHFLGLTGLLIVFALLTVARSLRDDFAVEIWRELGVDKTPSIFARSETVVMVGVILLNALAIRIRDNRRAFLGSMGLVVFGFLISLLGILGHTQGLLSPFAFMVLLGLGMYLPYVAFHTTIFERLIAASRDAGNLGFLMCLADAFGYLGYDAVLLSRNLVQSDTTFLPMFVNVWVAISVVSLIVSLLTMLYYARRLASPPAKASVGGSQA